MAGVFDMSFREMRADGRLFAVACGLFAACALAGVLWLIFALPQAHGTSWARAVMLAGFPPALFILMGFSAVNDLYSGSCMKRFMTAGVSLYALACACEAATCGGWAAVMGAWRAEGAWAYLWLLSRPLVLVALCAALIVLVGTLEHLVTRDLAGAGDMKAIALMFCLPLQSTDLCLAIAVGLGAAAVQGIVMREASVRALPAFCPVSTLAATALMALHGIAL